jgi:tRNA(Ser,Leu) C12 N-acetylase TAN1
MEAAESTRASLHKSEAVSGKKKRRSKDWKVHGRGETNTSGSGGSGRGGGGRSRRPPILLNNPKRGAPGIILTCDRGRESKCQREALQIIEHYYAKQQQQQQQHREKEDGSSSHHETKDTTEGSKTLSLEEELKQLQEEDQIKKEANFGIFDTGCSGLVFALCTVPGSEMIPPVKLSKISKSAVVGEDPPPQTKRQKLDSGTLTATTKETDDTCRPLSAAATMVYSTKWDPVPIVRQILQDIEQDTGKDAPSSRFVSRMIPLQATCYVSEEEMKIASQSLIERYFPSSAVTFAVAVKRRFCQAALPKAKIIDIVAAAVLEKVPTCKVDLDNPEVTVVMEICKTMCGLSVIPKCHDHFKNFNLAEARQKAQPT